KMAQHATQTIDTDIGAPPGTSQDKLDAYKSLLRSNAYSIIGTLEFNQGKFPAAEADLRKSIDAFPSQPDPVVVLRLALTLDKQGRYPDALKEANRAVDMTQENTTVGGLARKERDRLVQLNGGTPTPLRLRRKNRRAPTSNLRPQRRRVSRGKWLARVRSVAPVECRFCGDVK